MLPLVELAIPGGPWISVPNDVRFAARPSWKILGSLLVSPISLTLF
jgi:hypothetical protein